MSQVVDVRLAYKLAHSFHQTTGMELEELQQEALMAYAVADVDPSYDDHKAAWTTFAQWCIMRHLCTAVEKHKRKFPQNAELHDIHSDPSPNPEDRMIFLDLVSKLPDDAKAVIDIVFSDTEFFAGMASTKARRAIRERLSWKGPRIDRAFAEIRNLLNEAQLA